MARPLSELLDHLQSLSATGDLGRAIAPELTVVAIEAESNAKHNATRRPRVRSGRLRQSIQGFYDADAQALILRAGGRNSGRSVRYARTQDLGAIIRAKPGKRLAIPLGPAKTGAGVARYASARHDPTKMHVRKSKKGNLLLFGDDGGPPRYLLVKEVKVPATRFMADAADEMRRAVPDALTRALDRLLTP